MLERSTSWLTVAFSLTIGCGELLGADFERSTTLPSGALNGNETIVDADADADAGLPDKDAAQAAAPTGCSNECPQPANGLAACVSSTCSFTCNAGFTKCGGACCALPPPPPPPPAVPPLSAAVDYTCAATSSGTTKCFGDASDATFPTPTAMSDWPANPVSIAVGYRYGCAIGNTGALSCWGHNDAGQVGRPTEDAVLAPAVVAGFGSGTKAVATNNEHTCAIDANDALWCWGSNVYGALGDGTKVDRWMPELVSGMTSNVTAVTVFPGVTCAIKSGALYCWGTNDHGQLGDGTLTQRLTPKAVVGMSVGMQAVATVGGETCAVKSGALYCWGRRATALDQFTIAKTPQAVSLLSSGVTALAGSGLHLCAVKNGEVACWGHNEDGQLGDGTMDFRPIPALIPGLSGVAVVSVGTWHSCARKLTGEVLCWGSNQRHQIGSSPDTCGLGGCSRKPVLVAGL